MLPLKDNVPTRTAPVVTVALILANVAVWVLYQLPDLERSVNQLAYHPCEVEDSCRQIGEDWAITAVTSMFMHGSWSHLLGNMLFLWIFGNNVEDRLGHARFLVFYLLAGFAATALQSFVTLTYGTPLDARIPNLGASGAIAGVLGAYILLFPHGRIRTLVFLGFFVTVVLVPAWVQIGLWVVLQFFNGIASLGAPTEETGGVAFWAHIGGFVAGAVLVWLFKDQDAVDRQRAVRARNQAWQRVGWSDQ